jgi:uncharacterized protein (DUF58 family)
LPGQRGKPRRKTWKYLKPQELMGFRNLLFAARTIVEGHYAGKHKSPFRGSAPEFVDYRSYYPGDELRSIDWKAFARTDRHFVRLFEKETDMNCYLLVDTSGSMEFGGAFSKSALPDPGLSKLEYACFLAASLTYLMVKQGDKVGMTLFDEAVRTHVPPGGTYHHMYEILSAMEACRAGNRTSISNVLHSAFGLFKRRGLLLIISDMLDDPEAIFQALNRYTHRKFEIILFHVFHKYEVSLPPVASANFIDAETGEYLTCLPADVREDYDAQVKEFVETMGSMASARGIDYNFINTETPYGAALDRYLQRRGRML